MRIKNEDALNIKKISKQYFGEDVKIYLFGSRTDDNKRGGDIDLYIETAVKENLVERKIKMLGKLAEVLGEQKIDIVINNFRSDKLIFQIAKRDGIAL